MPPTNLKPIDPPPDFLTLSVYSTISIALGYYHTCAIVTGGVVKCWGRNDYGQLGIGGTTNKYIPQVVGLGSGISA